MPKRIIYSVPVDAMSGSLSGPQELQYGTQGEEAYDIPSGTREGATNYEPRLVAMYSHKKQLRYFQVRTKHSVNMTDAMRLNLATMGGAGAIYSAIVSDKTSQLYNDCVHACPDGYTLRGWLVPILRPALAAKEMDIVLADGLILSNPWNTGTGATVNIPQTILDKFASELGIATSPYNATATAVLMTAFPTRWAQIREYGFNHPALVPFINEDPLLVMSLIDGLGVRVITTDNATWIDTGLSLPNGARLKTKITILGNNTHNILLGAHELSNPYKRNMVGFHNSTFWLGEGNFDYNGGAYSIGGTYEIDGTTKKGACELIVNGTQIISNTNIDERSARNLYLFANNNMNNGASQFFNGSAEYAKIYDTSDVLLKNYVPYKNRTTNTMLDLVSLHIADLHGTLTISETYNDN